jgi:prepilin-type N-terminal cleavage/methylation domain-containing protein/prepilin-type processing-associated H-X9-DG protein
MVMGRRAEGFSLVELLVCVGIVAILMAMYLPALSKARKQAEAVVVKEGFRQEYIGRFADTANIARPTAGSIGEAAQLRADARAAFRRNMTMTGRETLVTSTLWQVTSEAEFLAYWHTLISAAASGPIEARDAGIVVRDEAGNEYVLRALEAGPQTGPPVPVAWEFLSSNLSESTAGTLGTNVLYSDGHVEYVPYPSGYPACRSVAELSHRFMAE